MQVDYCECSGMIFPQAVVVTTELRMLKFIRYCIEAQIELSSTFVYDQKMSMSGSSARNLHLSQEGRMKMMPMYVLHVLLQSKT